MNSMLVIKLVKNHEFGNLVMYVKASRNPVLDYMEQANLMAKPYIKEGWQMVHAYIER
jgi:hypothetical protein